MKNTRTLMYPRLTINAIKAMMTTMVIKTDLIRIRFRIFWHHVAATTGAGSLPLPSSMRRTTAGRTARNSCEFN